MGVSVRLLGGLAIACQVAVAEEPSLPCAGVVATDEEGTPALRLSSEECRLLNEQGRRFDGRARPVADHVALRETPVVPGDAVRTPAHWTGDVEQRLSQEFWLALRERHRRFAEPLLVPGVLPEMSARVVQVPGARAGAFDFDQYLQLSAYAVDLVAPLFAFRAGAFAHTDHFGLRLKVPVGLGEDHRLALEGAAQLPTNGQMATDSGGHAALAWAMAAGRWSTQVRTGIGVDRLLGELEPFRPTFLFDALVSVSPDPHFRLALQVDGRRDLAGGDSAIRLVPGARLHPSGDPGLSIGVGALWWAGSRGGWDTVRLGGLLDVGCVFL